MEVLGKFITDVRDRSNRRAYNACVIICGLSEGRYIHHAQHMISITMFANGKKNGTKKRYKKHYTRYKRSVYHLVYDVEYINDALHGHYRIYLFNEMCQMPCIAEDHNYVNGALHGAVINYSRENNSIEKEENYICGFRHGLCKIYTAMHINETNYLRGIKNGPEKLYDAGKNLIRELNWYDGKLHSKCVWYNNKYRYDLSYLAIEDSERYYQSIVDNIEVPYQMEKNDTTAFNCDVIIRNYRNGNLHGTVIKYYRDYVIYSANYLNGKLDGSEKTFSLHGGYLMSNLNYSNGALHGTCTWNDTDGELIKIAEYANDRLSGMYRTYKNGEPYEIKEYVDDVSHGKHLTFISADEMQVFGMKCDAQEIIYKNSVIQSYKLFYFGKMIYSRLYKNGKLDGISKWCDYDGQLLYEELYADGKLINNVVFTVDASVTKKL